MFKSVGSTSRDQDAKARGTAKRADGKFTRRLGRRLGVRRNWFCNRDGCVGIMPQGFKLPGSENPRKH